MARDIDEKKKRKALRKLRKAAERAEAENGPGLSDWEREFVDEVEMRVEKYGSAFADPDKGKLDEPLSALQTRKLKEIDKKSRGKGAGFKKRSSFSKSKRAGFTPRSRDIHEDLNETEPPREDTLASDASNAPPRPLKPAKLRLVARSDPQQGVARAQPDAEAKTSKPAQTSAPESPPTQRGPFKIIDGGKEG